MPLTVCFRFTERTEGTTAAMSQVYISIFNSMPQEKRAGVQACLPCLPWLQQVSEERLVSMLEQINERQGTTKPKITIQRRRPAFDDDDF